MRRWRTCRATSSLSSSSWPRHSSLQQHQATRNLHTSKILGRGDESAGNTSPIDRKATGSSGRWKTATQTSIMYHSVGTECKFPNSNLWMWTSLVKTMRPWTLPQVVKPLSHSIPLTLTQTETQQDCRLTSYQQ